MSYMTTTTRPADIGGIDLSGVDVATAIFNATGGGYGTPREAELSTGSTTPKTSDWVTTPMESPIADHFDFSKPPADRDGEIKLLAEPEGTHPLLDLFKGDEAPVFANGGPEGTATLDDFLDALDDLVDYLWSDDKDDKAPDVEFGPTNEKDPNSGLTIWKNYYTNPEADTSEVQAPSAMLADMLAQKGVEGIDTSSVGITDILGKFLDNMGKVANIVNAMKGAANAGDKEGFGSALADLMNLAGVDIGAVDGAMKLPEIALEGMFEAYGIAGGLDGAEYHAAQHDRYYVELGTDSVYDVSHWFTSSDDTIL